MLFNKMEEVKRTQELCDEVLSVQWVVLIAKSKLFELRLVVTNEVLIVL